MIKVNSNIKIRKKIIRVNNKRGIVIETPLTSPTPPTTSYILQEDGFFILQEDGSKIIIN